MNADAVRIVHVAVEAMPDTLVVIDAGRRTYLGLSRDQSYWHSIRPARLDDPVVGDCTAVTIEVGGRKAEITEACSDARHRDRAANVDQLARKATEDLWHAQNLQLVEAIVPALREIPTGLLRLIHRLLEQASGRYSRWDQIEALDAQQLAEMMVDHFTSPHAMRDVDLPVVLRELGVEPALAAAEGEFV